MRLRDKGDWAKSVLLYALAGIPICILATLLLVGFAQAEGSGPVSLMRNSEMLLDCESPHSLPR